MKFRKKPVVIEAVPVADALHAASNAWGNLPSWLREAYEAGKIIFSPDAIEILTLEGTMRADETDWLIRGVQGELYPCKPEIFSLTYERVGEEPAPVGGCVPQRVTLSGRPPEQLDAAAPGPIEPATGMHKDYWVLSEDERAKGFVRPVRASYKHVGAPPNKYALRDLTDEEKERFAAFKYVKFEKYPEGETLDGMFWTQARLDNAGKACRTVTTMARPLAETYARDPKFYGGTYCAGCHNHFPVGEFVWDQTEEVVGS